MKEAGLGSFLSKSPSIVPDLQSHPLINFANSILERTHGLTTMSSDRRYEAPNTELKSVKWLLDRYEKGQLVESIDVTTMVLAFQNISFSDTNLSSRDKDESMDISDIQTKDDGITALLGVDTDSVELRQVASNTISLNHNEELLKCKLTELSDLLAVVESLVTERKGIKQLEHKSSKDVNRMSEIAKELNRLRSRKKSFEKTISRLNEMVQGTV